MKDVAGLVAAETNAAVMLLTHHWTEQIVVVEVARNVDKL